MTYAMPRRRPNSIRLFSWNVAKRRNCATQAVAILALKPDLVVLQELNAKTWPQHREHLERAGLTHALSALDLAPRRRSLDRSLSSFVSVASRWPLAASRRARVPAPGAIAAVSVNSPAGVFDLIGAHIPTSNGSQLRLLKVETQEGLLARLAKITTPTLLCGDFNSPLAEQTDGTVIPFARKPGSRQLLAEAGLMGSTTSRGLMDLFRARHGYDIDGHSWFWKNRGKTGGYRLDHIFASSEFSVRACDYVHNCRTSGLSDHSPIYADVTLNPRL